MQAEVQEKGGGSGLCYMHSIPVTSGACFDGRSSLLPANDKNAHPGDRLSTRCSEGEARLFSGCQWIVLCKPLMYGSSAVMSCRAVKFLPLEAMEAYTAYPLPATLT